jgi:glycosyltransferase involved in cell wall biosynthesis
VIATDIPGHRQVAGDDAIRFVAPADANGLAGAIVDLERDPDRREALGRAGRALVHQAYRWDAAADAYEALLNEVVTSTRRSNRT